jgi:hypothetical protein
LGSSKREFLFNNPKTVKVGFDALAELPSSGKKQTNRRLDLAG